MTVTITLRTLIAYIVFRSSRCHLYYKQLRKEFIIALGGECQYLDCEWAGEGDVSLLEVHHVGGRKSDDKNLVIKMIFEWNRTKILPKNVQILCPNHHTIIHANLRRKRRKLS